MCSLLSDPIPVSLYHMAANIFHTEEANLESADVVIRIARRLDELLLSYFPAAGLH